MSKNMPKGGFQWYNENLNNENILELLENTNDTSVIGYALEVDISYPISLHNLHNELPYLPEKIAPAGSKIKKLIANLQTKKKYVIHYMALKQALRGCNTSRFVLKIVRSYFKCYEINNNRRLISKYIV